MQEVIQLTVCGVCLGGILCLVLEALTHYRIEVIQFNLVRHLYRQRAFSRKTFGEGDRCEGICAHIRKELKEIDKAPTDLEEWLDVVILGFDGAFQTGARPERIAQMLKYKQHKNECRIWPKNVPPNKPIEHIRTVL